MIELFEREARSMTLVPDGGSVPRPCSVLQNHARGTCGFATAPKRPSFVFRKVLRKLTIGMTNGTALIGSLQGASSEHSKETLFSPLTHVPLLTSPISAHQSAPMQTWCQNRNMRIRAKNLEYYLTMITQ